MYQFTVKSWKYGKKIVSIDDADVYRLFRTNEQGKRISLYEWHLGYVNATGKFYVFRYDGGVKQSLALFLTNGRRTFFADGNRLNCCRDNLVTRDKKHTIFWTPETSITEQKAQTPEEIQKDVDRAWAYVQEKYNKNDPGLLSK